jgi:hypothetical protein
MAILHFDLHHVCSYPYGAIYCITVMDDQTLVVIAIGFMDCLSSSTCLSWTIWLSHCIYWKE